MYALQRVDGDLYFEPISMTSINLSEQSDIHSHISTLKIKPYDGSSDVDEWLTHLTQVAALSAWNRKMEHVLLSAARKALTGHAATDFATALHDTHYQLTFNLDTSRSSKGICSMAPPHLWAHDPTSGKDSTLGPTRHSKFPDSQLMGLHNRPCGPKNKHGYPVS